MATKASTVRVTGPLADQAGGFRTARIEQGYTPLSAANLLRVLAALRRWLAAAAGGFGTALIGQGYTPLSAANLLRVLAHLSRWLAAQEMSGGDLTPER